MSADELRSLLEKYWEGESSLDEEAMLTDAFNTDQALPADLEVYRPLFRTMGHNRSATVCDGFEAQLLAKIHAAPSAPVGSGIGIRRLLPVLLRVAAVTAFVVTSAFAVYHYVSSPRTDYYADTFDTPEQAYAQLKSALRTVSDKIQEGNELVESQFQVLDDVNQLNF